MYPVTAMHPFNLHYDTGKIEDLAGHIESFSKAFNRQDRSKWKEYTNLMQKNLYFLLEAPYVDRVYRDAYYSFFASKHGSYERDCMRVHFFKANVTPATIHSEEKITNDSYLGYIVVRPIPGRTIGRSLLHPQIFTETGYVCCLCSETVSIMGRSFKVVGFPHSSQDSQIQTCAETTVWSVMEYFSHRYREYSPALPSRIIETLSPNAASRIVPSTGLNVLQKSRSLQGLGFSTIIYAKEAYGSEFYRLLHYYIESGIPLLLTLKGKKIAHATIAIGHENKDIKEAVLPAKLVETIQGIEVYESADIHKRLVSIDDNHPPYRLFDRNRPAGYYSGSSWQDCEITHFVVPLYKRIYLEAKQARSLATSVLRLKKLGLENWTERNLLLRFQLTSSRSLKRFYNIQDSIGNGRIWITMAHLPRFVWIAELCSLDSYRNSRAKGIMIIDATGTEDLESIMLIAYPETIFYREKGEIKSVQSEAFSNIPLYRNNLKGDWNNWRDK